MAGESFSQERPVLVLTPVRTVTDRAGTVPGAATVNAGCGHHCWISPSGAYYLIANPGSRSLCIPCAVREGPITEIHAAPGVRDELRGMGWSEESIDAYMHGVTEH